MKYLYPIFFLILLFSFSCGKNKRTKANEETIDSLTLNSVRITNALGETLTPTAKKELENWQEYEDVDEFILTFYNISVQEALINAEELSNLIQLMKDSVRVEQLKKPNVEARFNVLHNETLRLKDMANIPTITDEEVTAEVNQILEIYSSVNSKINTIYKVKELQNSLEVDTETPIELEEETKKGGIRRGKKAVSTKKQKV